MNQKSADRLKGLASLFLLGLLCAMPLWLIWNAATVEHQRRSTVLQFGIETSAVVTESYWTFLHRSCRFRYVFAFGGRQFEGGQGGCALVDTHARGASLRIKFDPNDPNHSVPIGGDLWPGWAAVPSLLVLPLLFLGGVLAFVIWRNPVRAPKRQKRLRSRSEV